MFGCRHDQSILKPFGFLRSLALPILLAALSLHHPGTLRADSPSQQAGADHNAAAPDKPPGLFDRDFLAPDPGGYRAKLTDLGIVFGVLYTGEVFGNPRGGYRQGAVYDGLLTAGVDVDLDKLAHLPGLTLHALAYDPHGTSGTEKYVHDFNRFSNVDAFDSLRLFELWAQTSLFDNAVNLRVGQLAVDTEFATTLGGALFIHSNYGTPPTLAQNTPAPVYPEAVPGVRLRLNSPDARFYFQSGAYAGNPDADRDGDPDPAFRPGTAYNDHGVRFPLSGNQGVLSVNEVGFLLNTGKDDHGLPGAYRLGGYFDSDTFPDERTAANSFDSLTAAPATPTASRRPLSHRGDAGLYAVAEQVLFRPAFPPGNRQDNVAQTAAAPVNNAADSSLGTVGSAPSGQELRVFARTGGAPPDRNVVDFYAELGLNYRGLLPSRGRDVFGLGFTYTDLSDDARREVRAANRLNHTGNPLPDYEATLEATYEANLTPWLQVQPDLQFIIHPGGTQRNDDALILGVRTVVTF